MTLTRHVDDLKVSQKESTELTKFIIALGGIYGNGLSGTCGKIQSYLSIDFNYSTRGDIKWSMIPNFKKIYQNLPKPITCTAV